MKLTVSILQEKLFFTEKHLLWHKPDVEKELNQFREAGWHNIIRRWSCCCFICFLWLHYVNIFDMLTHLKPSTNAWSDQKRPVFQLWVRNVECSTTMAWRELFVCTLCIKSAMDWINDFLQWSWFCLTSSKSNSYHWSKNPLKLNWYTEGLRWLLYGLKWIIKRIQQK